MRTLKAVALALAVVAGVLGVAGPAQARQVVVSDQAGDTTEPGLDITSATFRNRDRAIVATLTFVRDRPGAVIVGVRARKGPSVGIVSRHHRHGADEVFAFSRRSGGAACSRVTSDWSRARATVTLRLPARCLNKGNYGAVRFFALTEEAKGGADVDYAPQQPGGDDARTPWVPRG